MRFGVLAVDGCFDSGIVNVLDILRTADALRPVVDGPIAPVTVHTIGTNRTITTAGGLTLPVDLSLDEATTSCDTIVIPALDGITPDHISARLRRSDVRKAIDYLETLPDTHHVAAACTGTFLAGDAGLLNGHRVTTSWWLAPFFRARFPMATLDMTAMVIRSGELTTAGAAFGHIDLALDLVASVSPDLAAIASRYLIIDRRPAQSAYTVTAHLASADPLVADFEREIRSNLAVPTDVAAIAARLGTNRKTLERRINTLMGTSPHRFATTIRVAHADHLGRTTNHTQERIAIEVGYSTAAALRRARHTIRHPGN